MKTGRRPFLGIVGVVRRRCNCSRLAIVRARHLKSRAFADRVQACAGSSAANHGGQRAGKDARSRRRAARWASPNAAALRNLHALCRFGVNRVIFDPRQSLPVFPRKRTSPEPVGMSQRCQKAEVPSLHSITSSAVDSSEDGTERPRTFAVFRLMTNLKRVGCSMGRSPERTTHYLPVTPVAIGRPGFNFTSLKAGLTCAILVRCSTTRSPCPVPHAIKCSDRCHVHSFESNGWSAYAATFSEIQVLLPHWQSNM
jgi:hypothetical protein